MRHSRAIGQEAVAGLGNAPLQHQRHHRDGDQGEMRDDDDVLQVFEIRDEAVHKWD